MPELGDSDVFPTGEPQSDAAIGRALELYKMMVASSEALVSRRQGVNTFFLTINGAILTAVGLIVANGQSPQFRSVGLVVLTITGGVLALAWRSLLVSFGQLNTGKFKVINRIERFLPVAIYTAEWKALGEGKDPKVYRSFTSREVWTPWTFFGVYCAAIAAEILTAFGVLTFS